MIYEQTFCIIDEEYSEEHVKTDDALFQYLLCAFAIFSLKCFENILSTETLAHRNFRAH